MGGPRPPRKKVGKPKPMRPPWLHHLCAFVTPSFAGHSFRVISGETWYYCISQFTVVQFDFCLISNIFSCRYACITLE